MNSTMNLLNPLPIPENATALSLLLSSLVVLFAGFVRGLTGFGFSALCVSCLSVFLPPAQVVPALFVLEILASISLLKTCWPDVHWSWLRVLLVGNLVFIPLGVLTQQSLPADTLRLLIAGIIGVIALAQLQGLRPQGPPGKALQWGTSMVSGWLNGLAAIGGIAVAMVFNQTRLAPAVMRASLVVFFLFTDLFALLCPLDLLYLYYLYHRYCPLDPLTLYYLYYLLGLLCLYCRCYLCYLSDLLYPYYLLGLELPVLLVPPVRPALLGLPVLLGRLEPPELPVHPALLEPPVFLEIPVNQLLL